MRPDTVKDRALTVSVVRSSPGGSDADDLVFKALASSVRRRMLDVLRESPCTTGELCARFPELDRTTVPQHLRVLERVSLVNG